MNWRRSVGLAAGDCLAVGDGANDLAMIGAAGAGRRVPCEAPWSRRRRGCAYSIAGCGRCCSSRAIPRRRSWARDADRAASGGRPRPAAGAERQRGGGAVAAGCRAVRPARHAGVPCGVPGRRRVRADVRSGGRVRQSEFRLVPLALPPVRVCRSRGRGTRRTRPGRGEAAVWRRVPRRAGRPARTWSRPRSTCGRPIRRRTRFTPPWASSRRAAPISMAGPRRSATWTRSLP